MNDFKFKTGDRVWWWDKDALKARQVRIRSRWEQWMGNEFYEVEYDDAGVTVFRTLDGEDLSTSKVFKGVKCECGGDSVKCTRHMWSCPRFAD